MKSDILDIAIVGAGIAGIYSGWRLLGADPQPSNAATPGSHRNVVVFEMNSRIGGRLLSATPPGMPHVTCELGGMRYISNQPLCRSLVEDVLKLSGRPFPTNLASNICYLRGKRLKTSDLADASRLPYNLADSERGLNPGSLLLRALRAIVPGIDEMSETELDAVYRTAVIDGQHLYKLGFWNLLAQHLSYEAYNLIQDSSGYYSITANWNAGDALRMCLGDFKQGLVYRALNDGFESVVRTLAKGFENAGGTILRQHQLLSFDSTTLPDGHKGIKLVFKAGDTTITVLTRRLILAMPRRSLQLIGQSGCLLDPMHVETQRLINSVEGIPLFKLFLAYRAPWWEAAGVHSGRSTTTLPIRQCYYWGVEGRQKHANPANNNALLLASYEDVAETLFWRGYKRAAGVSPEHYPNPVAPAEAGDDDAWRRHRAPKRMVLEAHRQLKEIHGVSDAPEPYAASFRDWTEEPYGGGVHFWKLGYNSQECITRMIKPRHDEPVFIIGEAYSKTQGWVEGALETSELMLRHLGVASPSWVSSAATIPPGEHS